VQTEQEDGAVQKITGWRWIAICIAVYSSYYLYGPDTTIVADVQVNTAETFGAVEKLGWLSTGFALGLLPSSCLCKSSSRVNNRTS
jgi:hypothetical protein